MVIFPHWEKPNYDFRSDCQEDFFTKARRNTLLRRPGLPRPDCRMGKKSRGGRGRKKGESLAEQERVKALVGKYAELTGEPAPGEDNRADGEPGSRNGHPEFLTLQQRQQQKQAELSPAEFLTSLQAAPPGNLQPPPAVLAPADLWAWRGMITDVGKQCEQAQLDFIRRSQVAQLTMDCVSDHYQALRATRSAIQELGVQIERKRQIASSMYHMAKRKGAANAARLGRQLNSVEQRSMDMGADAKKFNIVLEQFKASPAHQCLMNEMRERLLVSAGGHVCLAPTEEEETFEEMLAAMKNL